VEKLFYRGKEGSTRDLKP